MGRKGHEEFIVGPPVFVKAVLPHIRPQFAPLLDVRILCSIQYPHEELRPIHPLPPRGSPQDRPQVLGPPSSQTHGHPTLLPQQGRTRRSRPPLGGNNPKTRPRAQDRLRRAPGHGRKSLLRPPRRDPQAPHALRGVDPGAEGDARPCGPQARTRGARRRVVGQWTDWESKEEANDD